MLLKMKDNIYIVKALTEYRFVEKDGKDQVRLVPGLGFTREERIERF